MRWSSAASRRLPASDKDVWAVVSDLSRNGEWLPCHQQWLDPLPTPPRRGQSVTERVTACGAIHEIRWTITEWTPLSMLELSAAAPGLLFSYGAQVQSIGTTCSSVTLRAILGGPVLRQLRTSSLRSAVATELDRAAALLESLFHAADPDQRPMESPEIDWNRTITRGDELARSCRAVVCDLVTRRHGVHLNGTRSTAPQQHSLLR